MVPLDVKLFEHKLAFIYPLPLRAVLVTQVQLLVLFWTDMLIPFAAHIVTVKPGLTFWPGTSCSLYLLSTVLITVFTSKYA